MSAFRVNKSVILAIAGLVLAGFFVFRPSQKALAAVVLPSTPCDEQLPNVTTNGLSVHINANTNLEDGSEVFSYGENFVSLTDGKITFKPIVLFETYNPVKGTIKMMGLDAGCNFVMGLGPGGHNIVAPGENVFTYELSTAKSSLNGGRETISHPMSNVRYLWLEIWDGESLVSYSYLVDVNNIQNPVVIEDPMPPDKEPEGKRPVLIIPGIMGSELYEGEDLIWPAIPALLTSPSDSFLSDSLELDDTGKSINTITLGDIVKRMDYLFLHINSFSSLIAELESNGYVFDSNYFLFPYDWRLDLNESKDLLNDKVEQIKTQTGFKKVDIVAHSMGGLLTEEYLKDYGSGSVDKLIFVGTPHLGAPKAGNALLEGNITPFNIVNGDAIKKISVNSPSIYQLLPNQKYFQEFQGYIKPMPSQDGSLLNYEQTGDFLTDIGKNSALMNRVLDLENLEYGNIQVFNIAGCKTSTQAMYNVDATNGHVLNTKYTKGDGTVPFVSADYSSGTKYYVENGKHAELPSTEGVRELIVSLLAGNEVFSSNTSKSSSFCNLQGKKLTWRSPVEIQIYDSENNHSGPTEQGILENNIPGASYDIIDGEKYIFLPTDHGQEYRIEGTGLDIGSFDLLITDVENDIEGRTDLFDNIQIVPGSFISFQVSSDTDNSQIDFDFDNSTEPVILSAETFESGDQALVEAMSDPQPEPDPEPEISPESQPTRSGGGGGLPPAPPVQTMPSETGRILGETIEWIPDGTLVLDTTDNRTVYMIGDQRKYGFTSEIVFIGQGFKFENVIPANVAAYELAGLVSQVNQAHPNGSLVTDGKTIWQIRQEKLFGFPTLEVFRSERYDLKSVVKINNKDKLLN